MVALLLASLGMLAICILALRRDDLIASSWEGYQKSHLRIGHRTEDEGEYRRGLRIVLWVTAAMSALMGAAAFVTIVIHLTR